MDDAQLRAKLTAGAGRVDLAEARLPEPPTHGEQRIIIHDDRAIFDNLADSRSLEMSGDLAAVLFKKRGHLGNGSRFFLKQHLTSDGFDFRVRKGNADRESVH